MANVRAQRTNKTTESSAEIANANNVPQMRTALAILVEAVSRLDAEVEKLKDENV